METSKRASNAQRPAGRLTRKRIPLSCVACRVRKLKCNREKPCQNCVVRGEAIAATCSYAEKADGKVSKTNSKADAEDMRKRIHRLESSIKKMITHTEDTGKAGGGMLSPGLSNESEASPGNPDCTGRNKLPIDTRSTGWNAILNDLEDMKDAWLEGNDHVEVTPFEPVPTLSHRPNLLNGLADLPSPSFIIASLPTRDAADTLVAYFFDNYNPSIPGRALVHRPSFTKQYTNYWADPSKTSIIWVGMLFAMMCYSLQACRRNKQDPPDGFPDSGTTLELYRIRTAQCIGIADVTHPVPSLLQTLYLYAMVEYGDERDGDIGSYLLSGTLVRLALQLGLHRDPSQHPHISPFEGEMRRRLWHTDLLACVRVGLPKSLRYSESDTEAPRNLYEEDLYEDMKELPPSRPIEEPTPMAYVISKGRVLRCLGHIVEFLHQLVAQPYEEVLRLDGSLMEARELIPSHLQLRPLEEMLLDSPSLILERYIIQLFFNKAKCLLHRKYWKSAASDFQGTSYYSRRASGTAAMTLLNLQAEMHQACRLDGPLANMKWYHFAITNHDFLLAAMIVSFDLVSLRQARQEPGGVRWDCNIRDIDKLTAIQRSRAIWSEVVDDCKDAKRAIGILDRVLKDLTMKPAVQHGDTGTSLLPLNLCSSLHGSRIVYEADLLSRRDTIMQDGNTSAGSGSNSFETDLSLPMDFDWDAWDQFLVTQMPPQAQSVSDLPDAFFQ